MTEFKKNIISIYKHEGEQWLAGLTCQVQDIAPLWNLTGLIPVENLSHNYVLSGFQEAKPIILKLGLDTKALAREALTLKAFNRHGAVAILNEMSDVLLLERAVPGVSLKNDKAAEAQEKIKISCDIMQKLHCAAIPKEKLPHIKDWLATIDKDWNIPHHYLGKARELKRRLLLTNQQQVLLHGDLHHDNIIRDSNEWKIIDPKGVIGYAINEVWAAITDIEKDINYVVEKFDFDAQSVLEWYFIHLILAVCWKLEDHLEPDPFLSLAENIYPML